jgi:hypothetical protein
MGVQMRVWLVAVALLGVVTAAHAEAIGSVGAGLTSCEMFTQKSKENRKFTDDVYFMWAEGFLTGLNAGISPGKRRDLGKNALAQMDLVRAYCEAHPSRTYYEAIFDLWRGLPLLSPTSLSPLSQ